MAIYSLRLTPVGKTTQRQPFTASAHIGYIARKEAASHTMAERMPEAKVRAMRWLRAEERADRVNARVADKLVIALPRELTLQQQITLVWSFAERLTQGRASWFASIHAKGKDRENPHCHLLVRDRDIHTGMRVVMFSAGAKEVRERAAKGLSAPTTLRDIRVLWEQFANQALRDAGRVERIDRRTLAEQGIGRSPQVHEGPNIRAMHERGFRPQSRERVYRNRAVRRRGVPPTRLVRYPEIDRGLTRLEYNTALRQPMRVTIEDRPMVRVGEAPREASPFWAHPPIRPQAELRPPAFNQPEPVLATPLAAPTPVQQQTALSQQPTRVEDLSPTARLLKIKQEERERSAAALASELPRAVTPVDQRPGPPVEPPARPEELSLSARLQKMKEEEAKRAASKPAPEPPRAMSLTERLMQARGI